MSIRFLPRFVLLACMILLIASEPAISPRSAASRAEADAQNVLYVGGTGGTIEDVAVQGGYAYLGEGRSLTVLDVSNPAAPVVVGRTTPLPGTVGSVAVAGDPATGQAYAYALTSDSGLRIVDVSEPANPVEVGFYDGEEVKYGRDVAVVGDPATATGQVYACVANHVGLTVLNVTTPGAPAVVAVYETPGEAWGVTIAGDPTSGSGGSSGQAYAYVIGERGVWVLDISDPGNPQEVGSYSPATWFPSQMAIVGDPIADLGPVYGYVAAGWAGLRILDLSTPSDPQEVGFIDTMEIVEEVAIVGDPSAGPGQAYAYVADSWSSGSIVVPEIPYSGVHVMDISSPTHPIEASFFVMPYGAQGVTVARDPSTGAGKAYVQDADHYLRVLDVSEPAGPTQVGVYTTPGAVNTVAVAEYPSAVAEYPSAIAEYPSASPGSGLGAGPGQTHAFIVGRSSGFHVVDSSFPHRPQVVETSLPHHRTVVASLLPQHRWGELFPSRSAQSRSSRITIHGDPSEGPGQVHVYAARSYDVLQVMDVSSPADVRQIGYIAGGASSVAVAGAPPGGAGKTYAYVAAGHSGLRVVDVSDPLTDPQEVGRYEALGYAVDVAVAGDPSAGSGHVYAYVADFRDGLYVIDVTTPQTPTQVGHYQMEDGSYGVDVSDDHVYVAGLDSLRVLDVSDPADPREVSAWQAPRAIEDVEVVEGRAYLACGWEGLWVLDVSDPTDPREVGSYNTPDWAYDVAVLAAGPGDATVAVGDDETGLVILRYLQSAFITGRVLDGRGNPTGDVEIAVAGAAGAITDGSGRYALAGLPSGTYTLTPSKAGCTFTPVSRTVGVGPDAEGQDFRARCTYAVSGRVLDGSGNPMAGVQIAAGAEYSGTTDAAGVYTLTEVLPGTYALVPAAPGYLWSPAERTVVVPPPAAGQDFVARNIEKAVVPSGLVAVGEGEPLTYTVRLAFPDRRIRAFYDRIPTHTTYISGSLQGPAGVAYDPVARAISGVIDISGTLGAPTTVSFAVRVGITSTEGAPPHISNRACARPTGEDLSACTWSNEVRNPSHVWFSYLPRVERRAPPARLCEEVLVKQEAWQGELAWTCDPESKVVGDVSLRLHAGTSTIAEMYSGLIPVQPGQTYTVSYWIKTDLEVHAARLYGQVMAAQYYGQAREGDGIDEDLVDTGFPVHRSVEGETDWTFKSYIFVTTPGTAYVRLRALMGGPEGTVRGTIWLDEVTVSGP